MWELFRRSKLDPAAEVDGVGEGGGEAPAKGDASMGRRGRKMKGIQAILEGENWYPIKGLPAPTEVDIENAVIAHNAGYMTEAQRSVALAGGSGSSGSPYPMAASTTRCYYYGCTYAPGHQGAHSNSWDRAFLADNAQQGNGWSSKTEDCNFNGNGCTRPKHHAGECYIPAKGYQAAKCGFIGCTLAKGHSGEHVYRLGGSHSTHAPAALVAVSRSTEDWTCPANADIKGCPVAVEPQVEMPLELYRDLTGLAGEFKTEWIAYLVGERNETTGRARITEAYFPPQSASGTHVEAVDEKFRPREGTIGAIHSHVDMAAFWSGTDEAHANWPIEIVINSRGESKCRTRIKLECGRFSRVDSKVILVGVRASDVYRDQLKEALKPATSNPNGYGELAGDEEPTGSPTTGYVTGGAYSAPTDYNH